jgi:hypothetical protein
MPFKSAKQEMAMKIRSPKVWREWVKKYGHHPGYSALMKKSSKKKKARKTKRMATDKRRAARSRTGGRR